MTPSVPQAALPQLPNNVPPPPVFAQSPTGTKPRQKNSTPTFLGAADMPSKQNIGTKQLIGQ